MGHWEVPIGSDRSLSSVYWFRLLVLTGYWAVPIGSECHWAVSTGSDYWFLVTGQCLLVLTGSDRSLGSAY
jgi:hypothetical protein